MAYRPLADEIRPQSLDQVVGQRFQHGCIGKCVRITVCTDLEATVR